METYPYSSSSSPPAKRYDVFLSFNGEDTRRNFTDHLSSALRKIGLFTIFQDDYALDKGEDIGQELMKAIEDSQYAVVVLSENYAASSRCLKELAKIVECMGDSGRIQTIFYHVNPFHVRNLISSDVNKQKESSFWKALKEHAKNPNHCKDLESWRNALVRVANESGYTLDDHTDEGIFIKEFVEKISHELGASLFGMTSEWKSALQIYSGIKHLPSSISLMEKLELIECGNGGIIESGIREDIEELKQITTQYNNAQKDVQSSHSQRDEAIFKEFVADISREFGVSIKTIDGLFGMTSRLEKLNSYIFQSFDANKVCFIGIHGMGGIGKSTLARAYYNIISHKFDGSCILQNVREVCKKKKGLVDLQKQLLSDILKCDFAEIGHVDAGIEMIRRRLHCKRVLIILDDVSEEEQLNALALTKEDNWFRSAGSIIIVTTREDRFLQSIRRYVIYRAEYLNPREALQLFSSKAFGSIEPPEEYKGLSEEVVKYTDYLPLALTVLGSFFGTKNTSEWEGALSRLKNCPEKEIGEKLKISFDDLNETDQGIFLDIACFFDGFDKNYVISIIDNGDFEPIIGITNLIDNSLLTIQHGGKLWMHDLLQEMGKEIVRKGSGNELGRQSRIWDEGDLYNILENKEETNKVEAIVICLDRTKEFKFEALSYMKKLRLLMISGFRQECDGPKLKYLSEFPSSFEPRKLVQLQLWYSKTKQLWNKGIKPLYNLKVIDLSFSPSFAMFEDFTVVPNLDSLILQHCEKLLEIHPSIKHLKKLILLDLTFCTSLEKLPEEINALASLQTLKLVGCFKLETLPNNLEQLKSLRSLDIVGSGIEHLPSSIFLGENLESINYDDEETIESAIRENIISYRTTGKSFFPGSFCTYLTRLDLSDCNLIGPEAFPEYFGKLDDLRYLDLSKNPFSILPPGISGLSMLRSLRLEHCENLICLEAELLPSSLEVVYVNYCTSLSSFLDPSKSCHLQCSSVFCLDCNELVKRQDGKMTALASLTRFLEDPSERRDQDFKFVVPQSDNELPSWFINQSSTASISINLDPNWCNSELIGFAMVFCFRANFSTKDNFSCKIRVLGSENWETTMELGVIESRMWDHLFLLYSPCEDTLEFIEQLEPQSCGTLEFSFLSGYDELCSACGSFGVRLVYEEDIEELKQITTSYYNAQKDVQSSHSQSISQVSNLRHMRPIGSPLWTGLRGILDLEDNLELDPPNDPGSNPSMVGNTHFGVFRNYTGIKTKFLDNLKGGREFE